MPRPLLALLVFPLLLAFAPAAPVPTHLMPPTLYFPTKVGTKWVYQTGDDESVEVITDVKEKDGAKLVVVGYVSREEIVPYNAFSVSERGLCSVGFSVAALDEPLWLLKVPLPSGNKWDAVLAISGMDKATWTVTTGGPERVEVPAGTFQAIWVKQDVTLFGNRSRKTTWYAPHVGRIKEVDGARVEVLKSFTPAQGR